MGIFFTTEHTETPFGRHERGTCKTIAIAAATSAALPKIAESVLFCEDTGGLRLSQPGFCN